MRIEQLRSFVAIYETRSFTEAAARLYLSQPAVTKHLAQLEEELRGPLFARTTRRIAPTKVGDLFYEKAREAIRLIDEGIAECLALNDENNGLTVGYEYLFMDALTTPWLREYGEMLGGNISMSVLEQPSQQLFEGIQEGRMDCAFVGLTSETLIPSNLEKNVVILTGEVVFVAKTHPLATREFLTIDDLINEDFIYPLVRPTSRLSVVARDFDDREKTPHATVTLHQESALMAVELGQKIINLPIEYHIENPRLVRIPYKSDNKITYYFIWNRDNNSKVFREFRTFVERKIAEL